MDAQFPLPTPTPLCAPFWEGTRNGRLLLQRGEDCGTYRWTPQILCPRCLGENAAWAQVSGRGRLYSYTIVHRAPSAAFSPPYIVAVVALEEGPLMLTRIIDVPDDGLAIDDAVEVAFTKASADIFLYTFRPAARG